MHKKLKKHQNLKRAFDLLTQFPDDCFSLERKDWLPQKRKLLFQDKKYKKSRI